MVGKRKITLEVGESFNLSDLKDFEYSVFYNGMPHPEVFSIMERIHKDYPFFDREHQMYFPIKRKELKIFCRKYQIEKVNPNSITIREI